MVFFVMHMTVYVKTIWKKRRTEMAVHLQQRQDQIRKGDGSAALAVVSCLSIHCPSLD